MGNTIFATLRINQWAKSAFILAPALFTLEILNPEHFRHLILGVMGFSLIASSVYILNDILNASEDRLHPVKRHRPIASGKLSPVSGVGIVIVLLPLGMLGLYLANPLASMWALGYFLLMLTYTLVLRRFFIIDIIVIAIGYVIRVEVGGALIEEPLSRWLLLCTFTIAFFLALIKRRQELSSLQDKSVASGRTSLDKYPTLAILDGWVNVLAGMTILCYALYTVDPDTIAKHQTSGLLYTIPVVIYGIFRYQKLAFTGRAGEDPAKLIIRDVGMIAVVVVWAIAVLAILFIARL